MSITNSRPPLKWAGGKFKLIEKIRTALPSGNRLIEPFVGSGVVFLNTLYKRNTLNDINRDLMSFYKYLKKDKSKFTSYARKYFAPKYNSNNAFYDLRDKFNSTENKRLKSALFLYINKHGYNGLCRYNSSGYINVPFGKYKTPYFPEKELTLFSEKLQSAAIKSHDFEKIMSEARPGDVIYCDPPYVPLSETSNFTAYSANGFSTDDQIRLANIAEEISNIGVSVIISNHYTKFTKSIYKTASQKDPFEVRRLISCNGQKREHALEMLAVYSAL